MNCKSICEVFCLSLLGGSRQLLSTFLLLLLLGNRVHQTRHKADKDRRNRPEVNGCVKENQTRQCNWQFVQSADHGVGGGRCHSDTPGRTVRNGDSRSTRKNHGGDGGVSGLRWEVLVHSLWGPVLQEKSGHEQNGDGQQVVVVGGVEVLEVGQLDSDSHGQDESGTGETVGKHPEVAGVHGSGILSGPGSRGVTVTSQDGGEDHQEERTQNHVGDLSTEPQDLTVSDQDDGQVLEDSVDRDRQALQSSGASVDHGNKHKNDRHPLLGLILVEWTVGDDVQGLQGSNDGSTRHALDGQKQERVVEVLGKHVLVSDGHQDRRKTVAGDGQRTRVGEGMGIVSAVRRAGLRGVLFHFSFQ